MSMCKLKPTTSRAGWIIRGIVTLAVPFLQPLSYAQTTVLPGETVTLGAFDPVSCNTQTELLESTKNGITDIRDVPAVNCDTTNAASGILKVRAGQGFFFVGNLGSGGGSGEVVLAEGTDLIRHGFAIGRIGNTIQIPQPGVDQIGSEVLTAQISTEVNWVGVLWNRRPFLPSWTQVVGTLQVRDLATGLVVASKTFLNERADLENNLPPSDFFVGEAAVNLLYGWTTVRNSSGVDLTAELLRGRAYRIEIEAKCEDLSLLPIVNFDISGANVSGIFTGGGCFFSDATQDPLNLSFGDFVFDTEGGFQVSPITVTVQDDAKVKLAEVLENLDSDGDGVINPNDACPNSDLSQTVVIDGCDSGVENILFENGCTISDKIAQCAVTAGNHGQFTSCVSHLLNELKGQSVIQGSEKGAIQSCAAQANLP